MQFALDFYFGTGLEDTFGHGSLGYDDMHAVDHQYLDQIRMMHQHHWSRVDNLVDGALDRDVLAVSLDLGFGLVLHLYLIGDNGEDFALNLDLITHHQLHPVFILELNIGTLSYKHTHAVNLQDLHDVRMMLLHHGGEVHPLYDLTDRPVYLSSLNL